MAKRIIAILCAGLMAWASSAPAQFLLGMKPEVSGSWYNPSQSGHGFNIEVIDADSMVIYWYT